MSLLLHRAVYINALLLQTCQIRSNRKNCSSDMLFNHRTPSILLSVTMEDPVKEVADLMESTKEEGWEKSLSNKQVTFVVYREGDQLNFFRVVDRGDGTLTPLSESMRFRIFSYCLLFFCFFLIEMIIFLDLCPSKYWYYAYKKIRNLGLGTNIN